MFNTAPWLEHDYAAALTQVEAGFELVPDDMDTEEMLAEALGILGRTGEALTRMEAVYARDTLAPPLNEELGWALRRDRQYEAAIAQFERTLELRPTDVGAAVGLAVTHAQVGALEAALAAHERLTELVDPEGRPWAADMTLAIVHAVARNDAEARQILGTLTTRESHWQFRENMPWIALAYGQLGDTDTAFEWLDRSYEERSLNLDQIKSEPLVDPLREDPRFEALLDRMGFDT